ncbi:amidohydrolase family protein [Chloroflexota bacterium]
MMKIDMYAHFCPKKFIDYFSKHIVSWEKLPKGFQTVAMPMMWDVDRRLEVMDRYEDYVQVLFPSGLTAVTFCSPKDAASLAQVYNDAMAEIVSKYPDKFVGAIAYLPINNIDAALKEIDRAINELDFKGIALNTPMYERKKPFEPGDEITKPIDSPELMPIYESMSKHKLPIWIHPSGTGGVPAYHGEERGKYGLFHVFGWPLESAMAMGRLVCSGILTRYPNLRFIIHHCGSAIVPALAGRLDNHFDYLSRVEGMKWGQPGGEDPFEVKRPVDYFRMFYADTALYGDSAGLMCGYDFFGVEHILFGTDYPWDIEGGDKYIRLTINAVNRMNISDADKEKIFEGNAKQIMRLE